MVMGRLPWSEKSEWLFPIADENRMDKSLREGPNDIDAAVEIILPHLNARRTCIQAGGNIGFWPIRLSQLFAQVITFEAEPINFECLENNLRGLDNIIPIHAALSNQPGKTVRMILDDKGNTGAYYAVPNGDIPTITIDELRLEDVDLIYLDIEGAEYAALLGAKHTICKSWPIIGVETKWHGRRGMGTGDLVKWICLTFDYEVIGKPTRLDTILKKRQ